jgi:Complex I intermediate-associated protein 30 (CIA30)
MQNNKPQDVYQATFDTVAGDWVNLKIPWHEFVPVSKAKVKTDAPPLDTSKISTIGLVYSRFDFNGLSNPNFKPGAVTSA